MIESDLYLKNNFNPNNHTDGMTPERLKNLKGNVKILSVFEYSANNDLTKGRLTEGTSTFSLVFNENKNIKEQWGYRDTKQVASKTFFVDFKKYQIDSSLVFDKEDKRTVGEWFIYNKDNIKISEKSDWNGKVKEQIFEVKQIGDTLFHYNKWSVDKYLNNQLIETNEQDGFRIRKYSYFPDGNLKSVKQFEKGNIDYKEIFLQSGQLSEIQHYKYQNNLLIEKNIRTIKYGENDLKTLVRNVTESNNQKQETVTEYEYEYGKLTKVIENKSQIGKYTYNGNGDLIEKDYSGNKETYNYIDYDSNNNWTQRIMFHNGKPFSITEREITYY